MIHDIVLASPALLTQDVSGPSGTDVFSLDVMSVARLLGVAVPLLVALITKRWANARVKAIANLVLACVGGALAPVLAGQGGVDSLGELFNSILNTFITGVVTYYGLLKPTGLTQAIGEATANLGLGRNESPATQDSAAPEPETR